MLGFDEFGAEVSSQKNIVEIFESLNGQFSNFNIKKHISDINSRVWSFPLKNYQNICNKLEDLGIAFKPIPKEVFEFTEN